MIGEIGDFCSIPDSNFCFKFENPSITSYIDLSAKNNYIYPIKSSLM